MSLETHTSVGVHSDDHHGHAPFAAEQDISNVKPIFMGLLFVVVVFLIGIFWATRIQNREEAALARSTDERPETARKAFSYEVGIINQQLFDQETRADVIKEQQRETLQSYGWTDRSKQLVHLPISDAKEKFLANPLKERK